MMADVIDFPLHKIKKRIITSSSDIEDLEKVFEQKRLLIDDLVDHYAENLINKLSMHGFDVDDRHFMYDYSFMVEALRSALYRDSGMHHPCQELSDSARGIYEEARELNNIDNDDEGPDLA